MQASTELCLAFFEFFTVLEKMFFSTRPSSPRQFWPVKQSRTQEKVSPFQEQAFSAFYVSTSKVLRCRPPSYSLYLSIPKYGQSNRRPQSSQEDFDALASRLQPADTDVFPVVASLHPGGDKRRPEILLSPQVISPQVPKRKPKKESSLLGCQVGF